MIDDSSFTYRKLRDYLLSLSESQLDQEVMLLPPNPTPEPTRLEPGISIGTIEEMCHVDGEVATDTRDAKDFEHKPYQVVILRDSSPFDKDGNMFYEWTEEDKLIGDKTGKQYDWEDVCEDQFDDVEYLDGE